jgi:hypothetical protein
MGLGCSWRPAPYEHHTSSTLLKSARRNAPTQWQDSTQSEYKTFCYKIVHNKFHSNAVNAPKRFTAYSISSQQLRSDQHSLLTNQAIFPARRATKKMMKSRFTNGN